MYNLNPTKWKKFLITFWKVSSNNDWKHFSLTSLASFTKSREYLSLVDFKSQFEINFFDIIRVTKELKSFKRGLKNAIIINQISFGERRGAYNSAYQDNMLVSTFEKIIPLGNKNYRFDIDYHN